MKKKIGLLIGVLLLGYGLIRIGVGAALLAQSLEFINFSELADAALETKEFISVRATKQIITFSSSGYFAYILIMGLLLSTGAFYTMVRRRSGFILLWIYIGMHAALFINFLEINPKLIVLFLQVILLLVLNYLRPPKPITQAINNS